MAAGITRVLAGLHGRGRVLVALEPSAWVLEREGGRCWLTDATCAQAEGSPAVALAGLTFESPEQALPSGLGIDRRSDLYALGLLLQQLLSGCPAFEATDREARCRAQRLLPPQPLPQGLPAPVVALVQRLLALQPEHRYQSAEGLLADLEATLGWLRGGGRGAPPAIGAADAPRALLPPQQLFGRDAEQAALREALAQVCRDGRPGIVTLEGAAGSGKTALAASLQAAALAARATWARGSAEAAPHGAPFAPLVQALADALSQRLGGAAEEVAALGHGLRLAAAGQGALLLPLLPPLAALLPTPPALPGLPPAESRNRLFAALLRVFDVLATPQRPLVLVLDDLQAADADTLQLIEHLLAAPGRRTLLLVAAWRDDALGPRHPLRAAQLRWQARQAPGASLRLGGLGVADVEALMARVLAIDAAACRPMPERIGERCGGNPQQVLRMLDAMAGAGVLRRDSHSGRWVWNFAAAEAHTRELPQLMAELLQPLPQTTREPLQLMACLGRSVELPVLAAAAGTDEAGLVAALQPALQAGLVLLRDTVAGFLHEGVQEAALTLVPAARRGAVHQMLARRLHDAAAAAPAATVQRQRLQYEAVQQYRRGAALLRERAERQQAAALGLAVARQRKEATVFVDAAEHLEWACSLLDAADWQQVHPLAFALHLDAAECCFACGWQEAAEGHVEWLLEHAADRAERLAALHRGVLQRVLSARHAEALALALEGPRLFGIELPAHPEPAAVEAAFGAVWQAMAGRTVESLAALPPLQDEERLQRMQALEMPLEVAFFTDTRLYHLLLCLLVREGIEHGASPSWAHGCAFFGVVLGPVFGRYDDSDRFCALAAALVDRHGWAGRRARVRYAQGMVSMWTRPASEGHELMRGAAVAADELGDLAFACYSRSQELAGMLQHGAALRVVADAAAQAVLHAQAAGFADMADLARAQGRFVAALRGQTEGLALLSGAGFDSASFEAGLGQARMPTLPCLYWILRLRLHQQAGDGAAALAAAARAEPLLAAATAQPQLLDFHGFRLLALADGTGPPAQRLAALQTDLSQLRAWAELKPPPFRCRHRLAEAEAARLAGDDDAAAVHFEAAAAAAREGRLVHDLALVLERQALHELALGRPTALPRLAEAAQQWERWGAVAVTQRLRASLARAQALPGAGATAGAEPDTGAGPGPEAGPDGWHVARALQALSAVASEQALPAPLLGAALRFTGARQALLLLQPPAPGATLQPVAEALAQGGAAPQLRAGTEAAPALHRAADLLRQLQRTHEPAQRAADPAAPATLAWPLLQGASLLGVLVLEHTHDGAFGLERLRAVKLLAAQAALGITQLRRLEAQRSGQSPLARLADSNIVGVMHFHIGGAIVDANDAFLATVGHTRATLDAGQLSWIALTPPDQRAVDAAALAELLHSGSCRPYEKEYQRADGTRVPVLLGAALFEGSADSGICFVLDLSARRQAETEQRARAAAEQASRLKSSFLANMSHEIRTPMNAILGMAHLALASGLDERRAGYVNNIHRAAESLLGILGDILDLSKIEAGQLAIERIGLDLDEVLERVAAVVGLRAEEKGLDLVYALPPLLPRRLLGDPSRLRQVLVNLIANAIKFTERGSIVVAVSAPRREAGSVQLRFEVRDTGPGIAAEARARLFQPFEQGDASVSRRHGGTGLGLAISRHLVQLMGGEMGVESEPGQGSCFHFTLAFGIDTDAEPGVAEGEAALRGRRVLVCDDNEAARQALQAMAEGLGLQATACADGAGAVEQVRAADRADRPFDIVILDWRMPGVDGIECLRRLRAAVLRHPPPTVLMVTAYSHAEARQAVDGAGVAVAALLSKPVTPSLLFDACAGVFMRGAPVAARASATPTAPATLAPEHRAALAGARLLLAEDNAMNQLIAQELLREAGVELVTVADGAAALAALQAAEDGAFDGVLMDGQMPVMDGYEATRRLRAEARWRTLPVIAMTADAMVGDRERAIACGMNDHVAKPVRPAELYATLARWVRPAAARPQAPAPAPLVDEAALRARGLDPAGPLYKRLMGMFVDRERAFGERFAAARGDHLEQRRLAHTLKSEAAALGADALAGAAAALEAACAESAERTDGADGDRLAALLAEVEQALQPLLARGA